VNCATRIKPLTDIRGDGGYVVMPPSAHPSGKKYMWFTGFDYDPKWPLPFPDDLFQTNQRPAQQSISEGVQEGMRNNSATSYAGTLLSKIDSKLWERVAWPALKEWNQRCRPPLPEQELRAVFDSIAKREGAKHQPAKTQEDERRWREAVPFKDLASAEFSEPEWAVKGLVPQNCITVLSGAPGLYKSFLLSHIAICCAKGDKVFDEYTTRQQAVMIVDEENSKRRHSQRIKMLTDDHDLPIYYHIAKGFRVDDDWQTSTLINEARQKGVGLLMFDTLVRIHGLDENNSGDINKVYQKLKNFTQAGITVLVTHHHRKQGIFKPKPSDLMGAAEAMRGSSDILGMVDSHLAILSKNKDGDETYLVAVQTKQRDAELIAPFKIRVISDEEKICFEHGGEYEERAGAVQEAKEIILSTLQNDTSGMPKKKLEEIVKHVAKSASARAALRELEREQRIVSKTRSGLRKEGVDKGPGGSTEKFYFTCPNSAYETQF